MTTYSDARMNSPLGLFSSIAFNLQFASTAELSCAKRSVGACDNGAEDTAYSLRRAHRIAPAAKHITLAIAVWQLLWEERPEKLHRNRSPEAA